jgi:Tol biopolymer transport system component
MKIEEDKLAHKRSTVVGLIAFMATMALFACTTQTPTTSPIPTDTAVPLMPVATLPPTPTPEPTVLPRACDRLTFANEQGIYLVNPDASSLVLLADFPEGFKTWKLRWSPDGERLAYMAGYVSDVAPPSDAALYVVNAGGTVHNRLMSLRADGSPGGSAWMWLPDSQYIHEEQHGGMGAHSHSVVNVETGQLVCSYSYMGYRVPDGEYYHRAYCDPFRLSDDRWWSLRYDMVFDSGEQLWALLLQQEHRPFDHDPVFSPDRQWVVIPLANSASGQHVWHLARSSSEDRRPLFDAPGTERVCGVAWYTDSQRFAIAVCQDDKASIWTGHIDEQVLTLVAEVPQSGCSGLGWSTSGRHINYQGAVINWPTGEVYSVREDQCDYWRQFWSFNGDYFLVQSSSFSVWDADAHELIPLDDEFEECEWSPNGTWLACRSRSNITIFNAVDHERVKVIDVSEEYLLYWSPNGQWLAISSDDGDIWIFDVTSRQTVRIVEGGSSLTWTPSCE